MTPIKSQLDLLLKTSLDRLNLISCDYIIEVPTISTYGDWSTNIAMVLFSKLKLQGLTEYQNPRQLAEKIKTSLTEQVAVSNNQLIANIDVAGPGFINFYINPEYYLNGLKEIIACGYQWGITNSLQNKLISVEYTDPNPFKELHLGHLYSNLIGEAIARVMEANGAKVWRADFYGDTGLHVAKSVWGMRQKLIDENLTIEALASKTISERQAFLGRCYAYGVIKYESNEQAKTEITHLNTLIHAVAQQLHVELEGWQPAVDYQKFVIAPEFDPNEIKTLYANGLKWSLEYFETLYQQLNTKFDGYYPESKVGELGYQIVKANIKPDLFEISDQAVIYPGEKYGLHTRVFINKLGLPTYEAKDIGLAHAKYQDFKYDLSINVTGTEIKEYFKVVFHALRKINPTIGNVTRALTHGMVRLPEGKMSSRTGNVITVEGLLADAVDESAKIITNPTLTPEDRQQLATKVGFAAIKYALLKANAGNDVVFSFADSITFSGNSGPYLQYTVARCKSVLARTTLANRNYLSYQAANVTNEEIMLLKKLIELPSVVETTSQILSLHLLCEYAYNLASLFNTFYNNTPILGTAKSPNSSNTISFRVALTQATEYALTHTLHLLGIETPNKM